EHRVANGLPALSLQWGPWGQVGLAAASEMHAVRLQRRGVRAWQTREALDHLERAMTAFSGALGVIAIDVRELSLHGPHLAAPPFFAPLLVDVPTGLTPGDARFVASLRATPALQQQRRHLLEAYLREQFAAVTRLLPSKMDRNSPVSSFGID